MTAPYPSITIGLYPSARGLCWIAFSSPLAPYDWGRVATTKAKDRHTRSIARVESLLERYSPDFLVLEKFEHGGTRRGESTRTLCQAIMALAADRGCEVALYTSSDITDCFSVVGATTRHEIAEAIGRHIPALASFVPKRRKVWQSERPNIGLFCAAALVLTHYHATASALLHQLRKWAEHARDHEAESI
jgi:Holliday junction resolvasome RuvABC endonuclease subunit